jgi:DNA-binding transcriptional LysR family regulator
MSGNRIDPTCVIGKFDVYLIGKYLGFGASWLAEAEGAPMTLYSRNLNTLPVLHALLQEASVVGAARRVGLSQPTVSGILARLRVDLDDPLLVRDGRGMRLTERARQLRSSVAALCEDIEAMYQPEHFSPATLDRQFVVAAPDHLAFLLAPGIMSRMAAEAPSVRIWFVNATADLDNDLAEELVDLGVAGNFNLWPKLRYQKLFAERIVAAVAADHPLASKSTVTTDEIVQFPSSTMNPSRSSATGDVPITGIPSLDMASRITLSQFTDAVLLAAESDLVAPAPEALVDHLSRLLPITKLELAEADHVEAGMFWAEYRDQDPTHQWLRGVVADVSAELHRSFGSVDDK